VLALILRGFRLIPAEARASVLEDAVHARSLSARIYNVNTDYRGRRGRPPLRPFLRAAAALAAEDLRPPTRPNSASHSGPVSTVEKRPGTLRSRSRLSKCKPLPRPRISTARISRDVARLRLGTSFTGKVIAAPFVSSICNARSFERYSTVLARASVFAACFPARDARAKFFRSSFSIHRVVGCDLRTMNRTLGFSGRYNCPSAVPNSSETT
jgi:hypothetical protein